MANKKEFRNGKPRDASGEEQEDDEDSKHGDE